MSSSGFFREFGHFLSNNKKFWLTPIILFVLIIIFLIILTGDNALTPFIYDLF
jgi:hypothetical protein